MLIRMSVKPIKIFEVPRTTRRRESPIMRTRDWVETLEAVKKEDFEALRVEFSPDTLALGSATPDRFRRLLLRELDRMGRRDVNVMFRGESESGDPILYVVRGVPRPERLKVYAPNEPRVYRPGRKRNLSSTPAVKSEDAEVKHESQS